MPPRANRRKRGFNFVEMDTEQIQVTNYHIQGGKVRRVQRRVSVPSSSEASDAEDTTMGGDHILDSGELVDKPSKSVLGAAASAEGKLLSEEPESLLCQPPGDTQVIAAFNTLKVG